MPSAILALVMMVNAVGPMDPMSVDTAPKNPTEASNTSVASPDQRPPSSANSAPPENQVAALGSINPLTGSSTQLTMFYHPPKDGTPLQTVAQRFSSMVLTRGDEGYRDQLRAAGYSGPVLQYLVANETSGPGGLRNSSDRCGDYLLSGNDVSGIARDFCSGLHQDERNFLHNGRGERLYSTLSWKEQSGTKTRTYYMMNPGAPGWRAYFASKARENLQAVGYSGLFLDNVDRSLERGLRREVNSDGTVDEYASDSSYQNEVVGFLAAVRAEVGEATMWGNVTTGYLSPREGEQFLPYLNGVMNEYFASQWSGTYATPAAWEAQLQQAENALQQGKSFVAVAQGSRGDTARLRFAHASYLLIAGEGAFFRYADDSLYDQAWLYEDYQAGLGSPTSARYQAGKEWRRDFTCGYVSVDVAKHVGSIITESQRPGCA